MPDEHLLIGQDLLKSTVAALLPIDNQLTVKVAKIAEQRPLQTALTAPVGSSAHSQYTMPLLHDEVSQIISILKKIQSEQGYNATFFNRQVNFLILVWQEHLKHLELKRCNTAPIALQPPGAPILGDRPKTP